MNEDLPELYQGELDGQGLDAFFADLNSGATIEQVQIKLTSGPTPRDRLSTLSEAHQLLQQRGASAVQLRYRFAGEAWCDTLMVTPGGVRLVRVKQPS